MAKGGNKNATKSFVMLIVTGVVLVAVTLCWFAIMDRSSVEEIKRVDVKNESSTFANIYYGVDKNDKIAIRTEDIVKYEMISDREIVLENMFPGAEYTYMAEFKNAEKGYKITLDLNKIADVQGNLISSVKLNRRVSLMSGDSGDKETTSAEPSYKVQADEIFLSDENTFTYTVPNNGRYRVYFSFKIDENKTIDDVANMSAMIENVDAVISNS